MTCLRYDPNYEIMFNYNNLRDTLLPQVKCGALRYIKNLATI